MFSSFLSIGVTVFDSRNSFSPSDGLVIFFPERDEGDVLGVRKTELLEHRLVRFAEGKIGRVDGKAQEVRELLAFRFVGFGFFAHGAGRLFDRGVALLYSTRAI
jgi:hypothetical protein